MERDDAELAERVRVKAEKEKYEAEKIAREHQFVKEAYAYCAKLTKFNPQNNASIPKDAIEPVYLLEEILLPALRSEKILGIAVRSGLLIKNGLFKPPINVDQIKLPSNNPSRMGHIFRNDPGHVADTYENRKLLEKVANDKSNFSCIDVYDCTIHTKILEDGRQVWVESRGNTIINAGINDKLRDHEALAVQKLLHDISHGITNGY